jgi:glycine/D-amino acid oxidase-like deaminating enzyme
LGNRCGLKARPSLYLASKPEHAQTLRDEFEARRAMQLDVRFLDSNGLKSDFQISRSAAIWSSMAFEIDPFAMTLALFTKSIEMGLRAFSETNITDFQPLDDGAILHSANGARIQARKVIFATGYETVINLPGDLCTLTSTYALVSEPLSSFANWPQRSLIWESARPYLYLRTTEDGRALIGGEDESVVDPKKRDALIAEKSGALCAKASKLFPALKFQTSCAWAGIFAQTSDGLPYIGELKGFPHCYFALGYGGNGITMSLLAARIILDLFLGITNPLAKLFAFDR